jgi:3-hydroxybutyryl-CoA dehydratase
MSPRPTAIRIDLTDMTNVIAIAELEGLQVGASAACELVVTHKVVAAFAAFSGDDNQLHVNREFAQSSGFGDQVAHGMIALSLISRLIGTQLPGHGSLWISQDLKFVQPVLVGETLSARVTVEKVSRAARVVTLRTEVFKGSPPLVVLQGTAQVRVPERPSP